jgi:hypothetical protein
MNWIVLTEGIPRQTAAVMGEISVRQLGGFRQAGSFYRWNKGPPTRVLLYITFFAKFSLVILAIRNSLKRYSYLI